MLGPKINELVYDKNSSFRGWWRVLSKTPHGYYLDLENVVNGSCRYGVSLNDIDAPTWKPNRLMEVLFN